MSNRRRHGRALLIPLLVAGLAMCSDSLVAPPPGPNLALGTWGGNNAGVIVTDSQAHVHIGCTFGDVNGVVPVAGDGTFSVAGSYILRAYPVMVGPSLPALFIGRVAGAVLTLTVVVDDTVAKKTQTLGPVTVIWNKEPSMGPCPICRVPLRRM
jgi:hypothetical protein